MMHDDSGGQLRAVRGDAPRAAWRKRAAHFDAFDVDDEPCSARRRAIARAAEVRRTEPTSAQVPALHARPASFTTRYTLASRDARARGSARASKPRGRVCNSRDLSDTTERRASVRGVPLARLGHVLRHTQRPSRAADVSINEASHERLQLWRRNVIFKLPPPQPAQ
jgi:hypothetical protein